MKKTTKATTTTLATPAPSPAKKTATAAVKTPKTTTKKVTAPIIAAPAVAAPAVKATTSSKVATKIVANIDVGFGNTLYIRGEGPGLNWEKGIPLDCVADDQWSLTLSETVRPVVFKFLINDLTWSVGDDYLVQPGNTAELTPAF